MASGEISAPVGLEEFAARCAVLNPGNRIALAVSGGRDSMALVCLAADYGARAKASLCAFTVDHGLRKESAQEAAQTAQWCAARGVPCDILSWRGEKPATGLQAAARAARYRLLAKAATAAGAQSLMTAHSADDQAETVFMRFARGAGPRGLAAMDDEIKIAAGAGAPIRLLRPLLPFSRLRLTATAQGFGQPFIDDPSNDDPAFERVRVRALLAALEENGLLTQAALLKTATRMSAAAKRLRRREERAFGALGGCFYRWGGASADLGAVDAGGAADRGAVIARIIHAVSGEAHGPDEEASREAFAHARARGAATLGGALLRVWRERLWFLREPGAVCGRAGSPPLAPLRLGPGESRLWDGRFVVENAARGGDVTVRALGTAPENALAGAGKILETGPPEALAVLPAAFRGAAMTGAPGFFSGNPQSVYFRPLARERFAGGMIRY